MTGRLLERDAELGLLREGLRQAGRGRGSVVLVSGEAGIGKTSLVRAFAGRARGRARVLVGVCDDLVTPRTLGPFRDMARGGDGPLHAAVEAAERDAIFGAVHQELAARPTVMDAAAEGLGWPSGWAGVRALGVDPAARGLGVGRTLMRACVERAVAAGAGVLCLHTAAFMTAAMAMYEAMGFRRVPSHDFDASRHLRLGGEPVPILAYRLDLPRPATTGRPRFPNTTTVSAGR